MLCCRFGRLLVGTQFHIIEWKLNGVSEDCRFCYAGGVGLFALAVWIGSGQILVLLGSERSAVFQRGQAVLGCGRLNPEQGDMRFVYLF